MKMLMIGVLVLVVISLGQAMFAMSSGPAHSARVVRALTFRISLSVGLFALLLLGWFLGWIEPHAMGR